LKIDTGLSRNGAYIDDWPDLVAAAIKADTGGEVAAVGVWSHFAYADDPGHPTVARQLERFREGVALAQRSGLRPRLRHLANSAATLTNPDTHFDLVRPGIAVYGLSPVPTHGSFDLVPAMSLRAEAALVKRVQPGEGVSYGHTYHTAAATTLVLVPLGYADGIPRHASGTGPLLLGGARRTVAGRVCMDQFVLDLGADFPGAAGDEVVLFGRGAAGEPTAQDWAVATGTINYEIVTRVGARVPRSYSGEGAA
jgi:alanine racemase